MAAKTAILYIAVSIAFAVQAAEPRPGAPSRDRSKPFLYDGLPSRMQSPRSTVGTFRSPEPAVDSLPTNFTSVVLTIPTLSEFFATAPIHPYISGHQFELLTRQMVKDILFLKPVSRPILYPLAPAR